MNKMQASHLAPFGSLVVCLLSSFSALASEDSASSFHQLPCLEIEGPVEEAVQFVEDATGDTLSEICIKVVSPSTILDAFQTTAGIPDQHPEIGGLFVISEQTVLIPSNLELSSAFDLSFLVHEIAHYHQGKTGLLHVDARLGFVECNAYLMQASFLRSRGLQREALMVSLQAELQIGSVCDY